MPASYLHGVETITVNVLGQPIRVVQTAVIGIVGCAPIHLLAAANKVVNKAILVLSDTDAAAMVGPSTTGFNLPDAVLACQLLQCSPIIVVNVFDPAVHKQHVAAESQAIGSAGTATLDNVGCYNLVVENQAGTTTYTLGTDYAYDGNQVITLIPGGAIAAGEELSITYDYADPSLVTTEEIIGGVNEAGARTGMQAWLNSRSLFGFSPRILIAPAYSTLNTVVAALSLLAASLRAVSYVDAPAGTDVDTAIEGRGPLGTINFFTSDARSQLFCPHLLVGTEVVPYSAYAAGMRAWTDINKGWWWSISNQQIPAITGTEYPITASLNDPNTEANLLNAAGITTVYSDYGTGYRTWGNRNASFPANSGLTTFECNVRTTDVIEISIENAMLPYMDQPLGLAILDAIVESVNAFLRTCVQQGAILGGKCWYTQADNPNSELENGHFTLEYDFLPPGCLERLTFKNSYNTNYYNTLFGGNQ